jgi:ClpP class serine protease
MHAVVDGMAASAGLWAASATGRILLSNHTDSVGSIGVISRHVDVSAALGQQGVRITSVASTPLKDAASSYRPLDEAGRAELQRAVDANHAVFVGQLARNLGVAPTAIAKAATGQLFHGHEAIEAGLAHGFESQDSHGVPRAAALGTGDVALRARLYQAEQARLGRTVTASAAVDYVINNLI